MHCSCNRVIISALTMWNSKHVHKAFYFCIANCTIVWSQNWDITLHCHKLQFLSCLQAFIIDLFTCIVTENYCTTRFGHKEVFLWRMHFLGVFTDRFSISALLQRVCFASARYQLANHSSGCNLLMRLDDRELLDSGKPSRVASNCIFLVTWLSHSLALITAQ